MQKHDKNRIIIITAIILITAVCYIRNILARMQNHVACQTYDKYRKNRAASSKSYTPLVFLNILFRLHFDRAQAGPPQKFFRKRGPILDDKTQGFEHLPWASRFCTRGSMLRIF